MSYDLESITARSGMNIASVRFATVSDVAGTTVIPGVSGQEAIVHQITFFSSAWAQLQLERATGAASSYWSGFAGQTQLMEPTRIVCDSGASVFADLASVGVVTGSGGFHIYYTYQRSGGVAVGSL